MKCLRDLSLNSLSESVLAQKLVCGYFSNVENKDLNELEEKLSENKNLPIDILVYFHGSQLSSLSYQAFKASTIDTFLQSKLLNSLLNLQSIDISNTSVTDNGLSYLSTIPFTNLQVIDVSKCSLITIDGIKCLNMIQTLNIIRMNNLRKSLILWPLIHSFIEISISSSYDVNHLSTIIQQIHIASEHTLKRLNLSNTKFHEKNSSSSSYTTILNNSDSESSLYSSLEWYHHLSTFTFLDKLDISSLEDINGPILQAIASIKTLTWLSLTKAANDESSDFHEFFQSLVFNNIKLKHFHLQNAAITHNEFNVLIQIQSLKVLQLSYCTVFIEDNLIDSTCLFCLFGHFPKLKELYLHHFIVQYRSQFNDVKLHDKICLPSSLQILNVLYSNQFISHYLYTYAHPFTVQYISCLKVLHLELLNDSMSIKPLLSPFLSHKYQRLEELTINIKFIYISDIKEFFKILSQLMQQCASTLKILYIKNKVDSGCNFLNKVKWPEFQRLEYFYLDEANIIEYQTDLYQLYAMSFLTTTKIMDPDTKFKLLLPNATTTTSTYKMKESNYTNIIGDDSMTCCCDTYIQRSQYNDVDDDNIIQTLASVSSCTTITQEYTNNNNNSGLVNNTIHTSLSSSSSSDTAPTGLSITQILGERKSILSQYPMYDLYNNNKYGIINKLNQFSNSNSSYSYNTITTTTTTTTSGSINKRKDLTGASVVIIS